MTDELPKGFRTEELLREFFLHSGYFVVRGVPFVYDGFDVTDIDLWLYERPSSVSRHRIIVDTKTRSTPKAIERIFWTKGLQQAIGAEQAIVATTDRRPAVTAFGREHGVVVLDGGWLNAVRTSLEPGPARLTEEDLSTLLRSYRPTKAGGDWRDRLRAVKQPFAGELGYNALNAWLAEARFFAEQVYLVPTHREVALRMFYLVASYICIGFDFATREHAFGDAATKHNAISEGLKYGSEGAGGTRRLIELSTGLIEQYAPEQKSLGARIRRDLTVELEALPTRMLAEYFSKAPVAQDLFGIAKELEGAAYSRAFAAPGTLSTGGKATLGVLLDFGGLDRRVVLQLNGSSAEIGSTSPGTSSSDAPATSASASQNSLPGFRDQETRRRSTGEV